MCDCAAQFTALTQATCSLVEATDEWGEVQNIHWQNQNSLYECQLDRTNSADFGSLFLAAATFLIYQQYYDKYGEVVDWRKEIGDRIKECLKGDIDHYKDVVMGNMNDVLSEVLNAPEVRVDYNAIIESYKVYAAGACQAAFNLIDEQERKTCRKDIIECDHKKGDIEGWATAAAISAADAVARFDEARVPRRQEMIAGAVGAAHSATFKLPSFDYQALSNAANIASSLASAYAGITNSALQSFGYYSGNFINSISGGLGN